ncbi:hypothetical protein [Companilactobacillus nodensis]|uniref:Surface layer protein A domain-containing protein n=1 Tax=Companilactobacillus nodensis DSM 19682 = JCM 14932 = NBRC 107160 TaxID=1423775 RepID=A0A0R1KMG6_9LACO|nr:hypothetical protein [Companilactobacillus nodensis]KRK81274.1 hypothetical protein FD03_GL000866 [Companilactobacillus nodensis DSM 19682 = JCM 14932 = NBRC 107160]
MRKSTLGSLVIAGFAAVSIGAFSNMTNVSAAGVATTRSSIVRIYNPQGNLVTNRALMPHTPWRVGKTKLINGEKMYQVATYEYVKASETDYDGPASSVVTKEDVYARWIGSNSTLSFDNMGVYSLENGKFQNGEYSIASINGDQVTIAFEGGSYSGNNSVSTFTLTGNKLESNSTHEVWYK